MTLDSRIADSAGELIKNEAFRAACEKVETKYTDQWRTSEPGHQEAREMAYQRLRALVDLLQTLRVYYEAGLAETAAAAKRERIAKQDL